MRPKDGALILAGFVLAAFAHIASADAAEPRTRSMVRAVVTGLTSGGTCVLRLAPNGVVQGASACRLSPAFSAVKRWRRDSACICLLDERRVLLLAFRARGGGAFRAQGVEPEPLEMRLLSATSTPMSP